MRKCFGIVFVAIIIATAMISILPQKAYASPTDNIDSTVGITRGEWLSELATLFEMTVEDDNYPDNYFSDLDSSSEYYYDILLTVQFGVVNVEAGDPIYPDNPVTREFAAQTLNFCLGYQMDENSTYTFSDSSEVTYPDDAQIALNRGWFELIDGKFSPQTNVSADEVSFMLQDAKKAWTSTDIDENYENTYNFVDEVIEIPESTDVYLLDDGRIYIVNSSETITNGDKFAVYLNGIPCVYTADSVEKDGQDYIIEGTEVEHEEAYTDVDMQGTLDASALQIGEAADGLDVDYTEETANDSQSSTYGLISPRSNTINLDKYTSLNISGKVTIGDGQSVSIKAKMKNVKIDYAVSLSGETFVKLRGDSDLSCSAEIDSMKAIGYDETTLVPATVPGVGGLDMIFELSAGGKFTCKTSGYLTTGVSYSKANGFRIIKGFEAKSFSFTCEAGVSAGIKVRLGITGKLLPMKGYVYTKAGGKAVVRSVTYDSGTPKKCGEFSAWVYASTGATVKITIKSFTGKPSTSFDKESEIFGESNSPIRVYHHYEDGKEVASCSRGNEFKYYTRYSSRYWGSGWSGASGAYGYDDDGNPVAVYTYTLDDDNNATITGYNGNATCLDIPETIDGYTVVGIGNDVFKGNISLINVSMPDTVTKVGNYAFYKCTSLETIKLSNNLKTLGGWSLGGCTSLCDVTIPKSLTEANTTSNFGINTGGPFAADTALKTVQLEEGMTVVPANLFYGCTGLESIEIPDTVTEIGDWAFYECTSLETIKLSNNLKTLGGRSLGGCTSLSDVTIPKSLTTANTVSSFTIGTGGPFADDTELKTVKLEEGITEVPANLFYGCTGLESIEIPDSVTKIGNKAFYGCTSLISFSMDDNILNLGSNVFYNCSSLKTFTWNNVISAIPNNTFTGCSCLETFVMKDKIIKVGESAFSGCTALNNVTWNENLETISDSAFYDCDALEVIKLPNSVTSIGAKVFYDCDTLKTVEIGSKVKSIGNKAFYNCDSLSEIIIPDSVTSIGSSLFYDCDLLQDVNLGTGITSIPESCFEHCDVLGNIKLPYRVASIGIDAFKNCVKLSSITIPRATTTIDSSAFSYPANMTVYGVAGTYAETFANEQGMKFVNQEVNAQTVSLSKAELTINKGSTAKLVLTVNPADFTDEVTWKSSDTSVATISDAGEVKAVATGTAIIKVTVGSVSASCKVTVIQPVTGISLNKTSLSLEALDTYQLKATVSPTTAADKTVTWTSSEPNVATVDESGLVTALSKGATTVTVKANDGSGVSKTCNVTVTNTAHICTTVDEMESTHNYTNNCSDYWVYTMSGATRLVVTFDERTNIEDGFDYLYIYDAESTEIGKYTGTELAGQTVNLTGNTVKIKLVSDSSGNEWGFKVTNIDSSCQHTSTKLQNKKDATCTENGYTGDVVCEDCGKIIEAGTVIEAAGHSAVNSPAVEATCITDGKTAGEYCSVCGKTLVGMTRIPAKGHTEVIDEKVDATCTENGLTEGKHCSVCHAILVEQTVILASHNWNDGVESVLPTCNDEGVILYTCKVCGETKTQAIAKKGHTIEKDSAVTPTCTTPGLTEGSHCSVCGAIVEPQEEVLAKGHSYETITTKATTKKNGSVVKKCRVCGYVSSNTTIYYPKVITLSRTSYVYSGKTQKPIVTIKRADGKTLASSNYTVTYSAGCKYVGKYTAKITFKGNYTGSVSKTFTIVPKSTYISSLTRSTKAFTVKWKKQSTQTSGYQIVYSTSSRFASGNKYVTVTSNQTIAKKITQLKAKKKYYVKVRTYKTVNGTKYYSNWSSAKAVITK